MDKLMQKYDTKIPAMRTIFKPPEGIFFLMLTNSFGSESQKTQSFLSGAVFQNLHVFLRGKFACVLVNKSQLIHRDRSCRRHAALQEQRWKTSCLHIQQVLAGFDFASFDLLLLTEMSAAVYKM